MANRLLTPDADSLARERQAQSARHHQPVDMSDRAALAFTKALRFIADTLFAKRYGHRAVVLETVAAVPGMVGGMLTHFTALRRMEDDRGWIRTLLDEAENERMHLMAFVAIARPSAFERGVILFSQWLFFLAYAAIYLVSRRTAHRIVGYFEEEAIVSYTLYLKEIEEGRAENVAAPPVALKYWEMDAGATLRDMILVIRDDEGRHRDVNHAMAGNLAGKDMPPQIVEELRRHQESGAVSGSRRSG